ncbi:MAG TPA: hypothetical protein VNL71_04730 [Chloroflexota bacterium]|nr:hypothetical protein [Chloroflexota bacterium]
MTNQARQMLGDQTDDQVADWMANVAPGSNNEMTARAEFLRRQTALQRESTEATKAATQAAQETAKHTRRMATFMLWSVWAVLASAAISAGVSLWVVMRAHGGG